MTETNDFLVSLARPVRHEANNLLAALSGTAELMLRARDATERDITRAERLRDASARLKALLHAYLALGAPPAEPAPALVLDLLQPVIRLAFGGGRAVTVEVADDLPPLAATAGELQQAVLRLALDAAPRVPVTGSLHLTLDAAPGGALLSAWPSPEGDAPPPVLLPAA
jgi:signal transduction histidine kinase